MTSSEVLDKIHLLPKQVQEHLLLYVDFLYHTYSEPEAGTSAPNFFNEHELTESGKEWLEKRINQAVAHPEKRLTWREAKEKIHQKHNFSS
jgi:hypothetical protein